MKDEKVELVRFRIDKARETLEDARLLAESGRWNTWRDRNRHFKLLIRCKKI